MKLLIASALLLSLTKAAQSVKQDGKIRSLIKRISRVSTFPAPKFFRHVLMKQFKPLSFPREITVLPGVHFLQVRIFRTALTKTQGVLCQRLIFQTFQNLLQVTNEFAVAIVIQLVLRASQRREHVRTKRL